MTRNSTACANSSGYAKKLAAELKELDVRVEVDERSEKIGYKIREAQMEKVPFMLVLGDKEQEAGAVAVRPGFVVCRGRRYRRSLYR